MQKPKNLLPGLFLCVFSRIAEPLVDFYCSNFWIFLFLFGADFFCRKERYFRPILYRPFLYRPILRADSTKNPAHTTPLQRGSIWHAAAPPRKAPTQKTPGASSTPERAFGNTHPKGTPRTPHLYSAALFGTHRPKRPPLWLAPNRLKRPFRGPVPQTLLRLRTQKSPSKNPGSNSRGLVDEKFI